jgi:peptidoglycan hydrolase CwlO-like protein
MKTRNIFLKLILALLFLAPSVAGAVICDSNLDGKSDQELQAISAQCDADLADLNTKFSTTKQFSSELEKGISDLNYNIKKIQLEIKAKNAKIKQLGDNIVVKEKYIDKLSDRMDNIKKSIGKMLRDTYLMDDASIVNILLSSENLSKFFIDTDSYATINGKLQALIEELSGVKKTSETEKKDLETKQANEAKLKYEQEQAKKKTEGYKTEKQAILSITKNKEAEYKQLIAEKEKLKNQIRNKLYRTAGGVEISFGDALKLIQPYESTIGVNSALVLAVLFQESAIDNTIGKNIGKCTYNQASSCVSGRTVMSESQKSSYLSIMSNIGLNPNTTPISCAICRDGSYGGAMGPAQFMPITWDGIAKRVSDIIGVTYPSPFENRAAFTASAVLLKDNQDRCKTAFSKRNDIWACAASKYYGGLSLKGSKLANFMRYGYGSSVLKRALQFEKDIDTLSL